MSDDTATDATAMGVPTLEEVAVVAGVSRATVSRVINDSPRVTRPSNAQSPSSGTYPTARHASSPRGARSRSRS